MKMKAFNSHENICTGTVSIIKDDYKEEYTLKDGKLEGEYKYSYIGPDEHRKNWQLERQCYYKDDKEEGESKYWHPNGQLMGKCYYKEGKLEGECKKWHYNGKSAAQEYYKDGKLEGEKKLWSIEGELQVQMYFKDGKEEGEFKRWYRIPDGRGKNGQLICQCYYKDGNLEGEYREWDIKGNLIEHKIYKNGEVIRDLLTVE